MADQPKDPKDPQDRGAVLAAMDLAALAAEDELKDLLGNPPPSGREGQLIVVDWYARHIATAGYKRLGKILRATAKRLAAPTG